MCKQHKSSLTMAVSWWVLGMAPFATVQAVPVLVAPRNEVTANTNGGVNFVFSDPCNVPLVSGQGGQAAGCESGAAGTAYHSSGNASAGGGTLRVSASAGANSVGETWYYADGYAYAYSVDSFAISGPANTWATLTGSFVLDGSLDVQVTGDPRSGTVGLASYAVDAGFGGATVYRSGQWLLATNGLDQQRNTSGAVMPVSVDFRFGPDSWAAFTVWMRAHVDVEGSGRPWRECSDCALVPGSFSAVANFGNTLYWGGIDSITIGGVELTGYQYMASASGIDYRYATSAVPEPAAMWLFGSGLLVLLGVARRKQAAVGVI